MYFSQKIYREDDDEIRFTDNPMRQNKAKTVKTPSELSNLQNLKIQKSPKSDSQIGDFYPDDVDQNSYNPMYVRKYIYV